MISVPTFDLFEDLEHLPASPESIDAARLERLVVELNQLLPGHVLQVVCRRYHLKDSRAVSRQLAQTLVGPAVSARYSTGRDT